MSFRSSSSCRWRRIVLSSRESLELIRFQDILLLSQIFQDAWDVENCPTRVLRTSFHFCIYSTCTSVVNGSWTPCCWSLGWVHGVQAGSSMLSSRNMCLASWELFQMNAVCWSEKVWCPSVSMWNFSSQYIVYERWKICKGVQPTIGLRWFL